MTTLQSDAHQQQPIANMNHYYSSKCLNAALNQFPILNKLSQLGVNELLVQIKATDARYNVILGEYKDSESQLSHQMWIPVGNCRSPSHPVSVPSSACTAQTLSTNFHNTTVQLVSTYSRQTL